MCNPFKPTADQLVFRQYCAPAGGRAHWYEARPTEEARRNVAAYAFAKWGIAPLPVLAMMIVMLATGFFAMTLIEFFNIEVRQVLRPLIEVNEFLNGDAAGRTLKVHTVVFAKGHLLAVVSSRDVTLEAQVLQDTTNTL